MVIRRTPLKRSAKPIKRTAIKKRRKPAPKVDWKILPDGREICSDAEYKERTIIMSARQGLLCAICGCFLFAPTFDHEAGRGMNSSKRDDRLFHENGVWRNAALCWNCNTEKGSKPYHWMNDKYIPKESPS